MKLSVQEQKERATFIYEAELEAGGYGGWFIDLADAQQWVDDIVSSHWWKSRSKIRRAVLTYAKFKAFCQTFVYTDIKEATIDITRGRLCESYLLHELTHILVWNEDPEDDGHEEDFILALYQTWKKWRPKLYYTALPRSLEYRGIPCPTKT